MVGHEITRTLRAPSIGSRIRFPIGTRGPTLIKLLIYALLLSVQTAQCEVEDEAEHTVFVSILPQKYFAERIVGQHVNVLVMVGPGQSPETYEPSPKQMIRLNEAILYFRIGVPFEHAWIDAIREFNPQLEIVECCEDLTVTAHAHDAHEHDPHIWTSPQKVRHIATLMKEVLIKKLPTLRQQLTANYSHFIDDLKVLHEDIELRLSDLPHRYFIVTHPAWNYYADEYDLVQISIESGGDVYMKSLSQLIEFARSKNIDRVFFQKQFGRSVATTFAQQIGASLVELDPLSEEYVTNLYHVTEMIAGKRADN